MTNESQTSSTPEPTLHGTMEAAAAYAGFDPKLPESGIRTREGIQVRKERYGNAAASTTNITVTDQETGTELSGYGEEGRAGYRSSSYSAKTTRQGEAIDTTYSASISESPTASIVQRDKSGNVVRRRESSSEEVARAIGQRVANHLNEKIK